MARVIWTGSLAFGLVSVPVRLYAATADKSISFRQFQAGTSDRIRYRRVNERTGQEVRHEDIVRGYELGDGEFVILTDSELEEAEPGRSRTIEISDFVDLADIDPVFYRHSYYLAPQRDRSSHAYSLLRRAMASEGKAAVATLVLRGKQYLTVIRPGSDVLILQTLFYADEIRDPTAEADTLPATDGGAEDREMQVAGQLIGSMSRPWEPGAYHDAYRERVEDLIDRKRHGERVVTEGRPPPRATVTDLMSALQASLEGRGDRGTSPDGGDPGSMTKAELSELASRHNIPGRSRMRRGELESAVRTAEEEARRRAS